MKYIYELRYMSPTFIGRGEILVGYYSSKDMINEAKNGLIKSLTALSDKEKSIVTFKEYERRLDSDFIYSDIRLKG